MKLYIVNLEPDKRGLNAQYIHIQAYDIVEACQKLINEFPMLKRFDIGEVE